jgi:integrase
MNKVDKSRNQLSEPIHKIRRGLAIYKVRLSPFWMVRVRNVTTGKYIVRSTKATGKLAAHRAAEEIASELLSTNAVAVPKSRTFETYAERFLAEQEQLVSKGIRSAKLQQQDRYLIFQKQWGLLAFFGRRDIATITTRDIVDYHKWAGRNREDMLSWSTVNNRTSCLRKILRVALNDNLIPAIPTTPKVPKKSTPRPFLQFHPLVAKDKDEYKALLDAAKSVARDGVQVRGTTVTTDLYDFILFVMHTFVRPTEREVYGLRFRDCVILQNPTRLSLKVQGKTGFRQVDTLEAAVSVYKRLARRDRFNAPDDYLFLPEYPNRETAKRVMGRWFDRALTEAQKRFKFSGDQKHTPYSLRHTAICMRLVLSKFETNIFTLARAAGTSVDMIENFYAKYLPPTPEMARNLQSFGSG